MSLWYNNIPLDYTNQSPHNLPKDPSNSTFLGNFRLTIFLIRATDPRTPPPYKWYPYEHHYYILSYFIYILHLPNNFNIPHCRSIYHGLLQKHLCGSHRQIISLSCIFLFPNSLVQNKTIYILLLYSHPVPEASIFTHLPWVTPFLLWPSPSPNRAYYLPLWIFPPLPLINLPILANPSR